MRFPDSHALACAAARVADDKKADDTLVLEVGELLSITEYFVVTSASNRRLVRTIVDSIEEDVRAQLGRSPLRVEGVSEQQWVLMDYGDVVVHLMQPEAREYYDLDGLYGECTEIDWRSVELPALPLPRHAVAE